MSRPYGVLIDGLNQGVRLEGKGYRGTNFDLTTMALDVVGGGTDSWLLDIYADTGRGNSRIGRIRTLPWGHGNRTLAFCACPGARAWEIQGRRIIPTKLWPDETEGEPLGLSSNRRLGINMCGTRFVGGPWGITVNRGFAEIARTPKYVTGTSGAFVVRGNVVGYTAFNANGIDGSVVVNNNAPQVVPANGGLVQGPDVEYLGYANYFNFVGTTAYRVDYEIENPFEGAGT
jgi:hypothetical protein